MEVIFKKMGLQEKQKKQKETAILDAALKLFVINGFDKTSISQIAREAGVAKGTVYLYYQSKLELLGSVISVPLKHMDSIFGKIINLDIHTFDKMNLIDEAAQNYLEKYSEYPKLHMTLMLQGPSDMHSQLSEIFATKYKFNFPALIKDMLQKGVDKGELRSDLNIHKAALKLWFLHESLEFFGLMFSKQNMLVKKDYFQNDDVKEVLQEIFELVINNMKAPNSKEFTMQHKKKFKFDYMNLK